MPSTKISNALLSKPISLPHLNGELKLGAAGNAPLTLKNRVVMASLTRDRGFKHAQLMKEHYVQRASVGLILSEATLIEPQGLDWRDAPGIYNQEQIDGWKKVTDAVHAAGSLIFAQLWHLGRVNHPELQGNKPIYGPSAVAAAGGKFRSLPGKPGYVKPEAIQNPKDYLALYKKAAENAKAAGFDGVELHSANGYLPNQFLDPIANTRTDSYGGSPENHARFSLEAIDALIGVFGADRVGIKLSPCGGFNDMRGGDETLPTFTYLVRELDARKIAYIQLARYVPDFFGGTEVDIVRHFRPIIANSKLFINGAFTPSEAETWIEKGDADAVVFGRHVITTPDFAARAVRGVEYNKQLDFGTLYPKEEDPSLGYTDYPFWGEPGTEEQQNASEANDDLAPHN